MGWTGHYFNGTRADRIRKMANYWNWDNETYRAECLDYSMKGTTLYCAVRFTDKKTGKQEIKGTVTLSRLRGTELLTKEMTEDVGPCEHACPRRILDKLTPTDHPWALEWREKCRKAAETQDHNVVPRKFAKILGSFLRGNITGPFEITQRSGYLLGKHIPTGNLYTVPAAYIRNKAFFHVDQIIKT